MATNREMFGVDDIDAYTEQIEASPFYMIGGPSLCIISILSDAQELLDSGLKEPARQHINIAKHLVLRYLALKVKGGAPTVDDKGTNN